MKILSKSIALTALLAGLASAASARLKAAAAAPSAAASLPPRRRVSLRRRGEQGREAVRVLHLPASGPIHAAAFSQ